MHHGTGMDWLQSQCAATRSFSELREVATAEIQKFEDGCEVVCGPITTGGFGTMQRNKEVLRALIHYLRAQGTPVFDQMPYENAILRLRDEWFRADRLRVGQYCWPILHEFYKPVYSAGVIVQANFAPLWFTSTGSVWEREHFATSRTRIVDRSHEFVTFALRSYYGRIPA